MKKQTEETPRETINVVAAVVKEGDKYLCMQRPRSHRRYISEHWEFPGGKVEEGETDHEALVREIKEEMDWDIYVGRRIGTVEHSYRDFDIRLTAYWCRGGEGEFILKQHLDAKWLKREEMGDLKWTEADRKMLELL